MAHSASAKKRMRQNEKQRLRNKSARSKMRTLIKKFRALVDEGKVSEAETFYPTVAKEIDMTARKGAIHTNTASRYKSRLQKLLNQAKVTDQS